MAKRVRNEFPVLLGPGVPKVQNGVENESMSTSFQLTIFSLFRLHLGLIGPLGPRGLWGRKAPRTRLWAQMTPVAEAPQNAAMKSAVEIHQVSWQIIVLESSPKRIDLALSLNEFQA